MISLENSNWSRFVILLGLRGSLKMIKKLHIVRCNVFSTVDMKEIVIQPKWDTLKIYNSRSVKRLFDYLVDKVFVL